MMMMMMMMMMMIPDLSEPCSFKCELTEGDKGCIAFGLDPTDNYFSLTISHTPLSLSVFR